MHPRSERREFPRYPVNSQTHCDLTIGGVLGFRAMAVHDLSVSGLQLLLDIPIPAGTVLRVRLHNPAGQLVSTRTSRVAYSQPAPGGTFLVGAFFSHGLSLAELEGLRGPDPRDKPILTFIWDPGAEDLSASFR